jgi:hypothetical protein
VPPVQRAVAAAVEGEQHPPRPLHSLNDDRLPRQFLLCNEPCFAQRLYACFIMLACNVHTHAGRCRATHDRAELLRSHELLGGAAVEGGPIQLRCPQRPAQEVCPGGPLPVVVRVAAGHVDARQHHQRTLQAQHRGGVAITHGQCPHSQDPVHRLIVESMLASHCTCCDQVHSRKRHA